MLTWNDHNPFDAASEPAGFAITMANDGETYALTMDGFGLIARAPSKQAAKDRADVFISTIKDLPASLKS